MAPEVLAYGGRERAPGEWSWRADRVTRTLALAVAGALLVGVSTVRAAPRPAPVGVAEAAPASPVAPQPMRVVVRAADPAALVQISSTPGGLELRPVQGPSLVATRRVAQLVAIRVCRNIQQPRFRRESSSPDGRAATYVVGSRSDTPRKSAGFVLRLRWHDGGYAAQVSGAYGGCARA